MYLWPQGYTLRTFQSQHCPFQKRVSAIRCALLRHFVEGFSCSVDHRKGDELLRKAHTLAVQGDVRKRIAIDEPV